MLVNPEVGAVAKFGGDSMKPANIPQVLEIAGAEGRDIITASAPFGVTDHLVKFVETGDRSELDPVFDTFAEAAKATGRSRRSALIASEAIRELRGLSATNKHRVLASGERFSGRLLAGALKVPYEEPLYFGSSDPTNVDELRTAQNLATALRVSPKIVAAAFFGRTPGNRVVTMGRNMSDVSGSIFTNLSGSKMYENWKGVDGIFETDPRTVPNAKKLSGITYTEVRELGGKFLHRNAVLWLEKQGITTHLRPTNDPEVYGTLITDERKVSRGELVHSIAVAPNMRYFRIHETGMNESHGVIDQITRFFDRHGLSVDHVPSGIDTIALVANNDQFGEKDGQVDLDSFYEQLQKNLSPKTSMSTEPVALIYLVGHGMQLNGNLAVVEHKRSGALLGAGIPLLGSESQPENPACFLMVPPDRADDAVLALHKEFFGSRRKFISS